MRLLLTGFEPFGGSPINPSGELARRLDGRRLGALHVVGRVLPVERQRAPTALQAALAEAQPDVVLALGVAVGRARLSVERVAVNLLDFPIPDNAGAQAQDEAVVPGGPAAYFSTLPVRALVGTIQGAGVPAELSLSAGSYLCNQLLYLLLHDAAQRGIQRPAAFVHLPALPEQANALPQPVPSMSLATMARALHALIARLADGSLGA